MILDASINRRLLGEPERDGCEDIGLPSGENTTELAAPE
jgi:hypothetical protein